MREHLEKRLAYTPPGTEYLNLATNENFSLDYDTLMSLTLDQLMEGQPLSQYGQSNHITLREKYAAYLEVNANQVLPAPGSESLIGVLLNAFVTDTFLTFDTDFFRYGEIGHVLGKRHLMVDIRKGVTGLIKTAESTRINLVMLSNPNNPLGIVHSEEDLIRLLDQTNCYVVIDEAYGEYYGRSMAHLLPRYPQLILLRTMSKAWGLAGLRVGFMIGNKDVVSYVNAVQGPFVLSDLNANVAGWMLDEEATMVRAASVTKKVRTDFLYFLKDYDVMVYPSETNFVYLETPLALTVANELLKEKIAVMARPDGLRITIGTEKQMNRLKLNLARLLPRK